MCLWKMQHVMEQKEEEEKNIGLLHDSCVIRIQCGTRVSEEDGKERNEKWIRESEL